MNFDINFTLFSASDLKELFDLKTDLKKVNLMKTSQLEKNGLTLLVSGATNKGINDELILKKWLQNNWIYTVDKKYRLDIMEPIKQQHLEFNGLFRGRKMEI